MEISSKFRRIFVLTVAIFVFLQKDEAHAAITTCGGTMHGRTGTFTSPNYPHSPRRGPEAVGTSASDDDSDIVTCEWKIIVPSGRGIQLNFGDFDMAAGLDECAKGELEVFSGINENKRSLDKYCGGDELNTVLISSNKATVVFRRPTEFSGKGFLASYIENTPGAKIYDFVTCVNRGTNHVGVASYSVLCPGGCANIADMFIRGRQAYRDDSCVCKAAVHAGVISDFFGGRIDVKKLPGKTLYMGSEANGVISAAGAMSDTMFQFIRPDDYCEDKIEFQESQITASSYWTGDEEDKEKTVWKPDKAILGKQVAAWSPNNPTTEQWLQIDLKETKLITAIITRGSSQKYYTTKSYKIAYRNNTRSPWRFYREDGVRRDKVFVGNQNIFHETRNNFVHPRILGRFIRIYPTPVASRNLRYSLQIALSGCDIEGDDLIEPPLLPPEKSVSIADASTFPTSSTTKSVTVSETKDIASENAPKHQTTQNSLPGGGESTTNGKVIKVPIKTPVVPVDGKKPTINENSIIVIAIVAALAVTSILLAALVLILVRKRKKEPKDGPVTSHPMQTVPDNNNTRFYYKSKKSRKRSRKNMGEYFQNADYKDTLLQVSIPQHTMVASQSVALPSDQAQFVARTGSQNGTIPFLQNGAMPQHSSFLPPDETDSFVTEDDDDHEYQVIDDDHVVSAGKTPVPSMGRGSSKASTGSSMGTHSRKSDTMQHSWGVDGSQWKNQPTFPPNSPIFPMQEYSLNSRSQKPHMSSFTSKPSHNGGLFNPKGSHLSRNHTFSQETRYSAGEVPPHPSNLRRGNSQSPSRMQRHSSSSNNSSHSYPLNGVPPHPHDVSGPYYSSVPNGDDNPTSLNHMMYGGPAIPEQIEIPASATKRAPSYRAARPYGDDVSALPSMVGNGGVPNMQHGSDPSIGFNRNMSSQMRSDYDRLYRNNSAGGPTENKNVFSVSNGSHSQYNQLNLNGANV